MLILRCTAKLLSRLKAPVATAPPPSTTRLGDWYATILAALLASLAGRIYDDAPQQNAIAVCDLR